MHKIFSLRTTRATRSGLLFALAGAVLAACGGGGGGGSTPTVLQANPTTPWELMTAGDIAQCLFRPPADTNAEKTARLVERQLAGAGGNANVLTLGDNAYLATAQPCVAAAWHHPRFSSAPAPGGDNTTMTSLWDILDQAKADVVLQGHEHHYERFAPMTADGTVSTTGGMRSFVVGTGGAQTYAYAALPRPGSEKQVVAYGVMRLSLSAGNARWRFIDVDDVVRDEGAFACRQK